MFADVGPRLWGYPALGTVFFLVAAVGGLVLVARILWHDRPVRRTVKRTDRRARLSDDAART